MVTLASLSPIIKQNGAWSVSKLGVISQCSLKFDYKYGSNKLPEAPSDDPSAVIGTVVHRALELALGGMKTGTAFQVAIQERELLSDQIDRIHTFEQQVERFAARMMRLREQWGVKNTLNHVMIERKWGLDENFKGCGFFEKNVVFRGVVDYALVTAKNNMAIIDHKTGREKPLAEYDAQFKSYCLLALAKDPSLKAVHTGINFVQSDRLEWSEKVVPAEQIIEEYRPWLLNYITDACKGLNEPPKPTKQTLCDWCGYKPICPAYGGAGRGNNQNP